MASSIGRHWSLIPVAVTCALAPGCLETSGDDGGASSGASGTGGTGGSGGGTGGTAGSGVRCDDADPIVCPSAEEMSLCLDGVLRTLDCVTACAERGFESGPCAEPQGCACAAPTDTVCEVGVNAFCSCVEGTDTPCDASDPASAPLNLYVTCHLGDPPENAQFLACLADHVDGAGHIDCQAAADACT